MYIKYQQIPDDLRDDVRLVNDQGHAPYIIYLLLKRYPLRKIPSELLKMNLYAVSTKSLEAFWSYALKPLLEKEGFGKLYKKYDVALIDKELTIGADFVEGSDFRLRFIEKIILPTGTSVFWSEEVRKFYRGGLPKKSNGEPLMRFYTSGWESMLSHEKRHLIDNFLAEGRTSQEIAEHFQAAHNEQIDYRSIESYAEGFMNAKMYNIARMIDDIENRLNNIRSSIEITKNDDSLSLGEKSVIITQLKKTENQISGQLKKMRSLHNSGSFATATLEYVNLRDILGDILERTHKRFVMMDVRTDDDVIQHLQKLAATVDRMTNRILAVDEVASAVETRSITEEMIEVISPTLDRMEEEEREAIREYEALIGIEHKPKSHEEELEGILGFD